MTSGIHRGRLSIQLPLMKRIVHRIGSPVKITGLTPRRWAGILLVGAAGILFGGCAITPLSDRVFGPGYHPTNVYRSAEVLPEHVRRVAVLPLAVSEVSTSINYGRETLEPVLQAELGKTGLFEIVHVSPADLRQRTGRASWTGQERLPQDFFQQIKEATDCDAVFFSHLTQYRAYPPLVIGWRFRLVDGQKPWIWWSADEMFSAGDPLVSNSARRYYQENLRGSRLSKDSRTILNSPRYFGHYTVSTILETLPARKDAKFY